VSNRGRRELLLVALGALLGVVGGGAAWVLVHLIALLTNLALLHRHRMELPSLTHSRADRAAVRWRIGALGGRPGVPVHRGRRLATRLVEDAAGPRPARFLASNPVASRMTRTRE